jgi:hypothetical protein
VNRWRQKANTGEAWVSIIKGTKVLDVGISIISEGRG